MKRILDTVVGLLAVTGGLIAIAWILAGVVNAIRRHHDVQQASSSAPPTAQRAQVGAAAGRLFGYAIGERYPYTNRTRLLRGPETTEYVVVAENPVKPVDVGAIYLTVSTLSLTIVAISAYTEFADAGARDAFLRRYYAAISGQYGFKGRRVDFDCANVSYAWYFLYDTKKTKKNQIPFTGYDLRLFDTVRNEPRDNCGQTMNVYPPMRSDRNGVYITLKADGERFGAIQLMLEKEHLKVERRNAARQGSTRGL